jgi:hypothetical protein
MSVDEAEDSTPILSTDNNLKELLGLFDVPAFARRGLELEYSVNRVHKRCRLKRNELLEMVRLRLRQWSQAATGPDEWSSVFTAPLDSLWLLAVPEEAPWAVVAATARHRRMVARDLISSVQRFNHRWLTYLHTLNLDPTNQTIDLFNSYYLLEKECVMRSARLAARNFTPVPRFSVESLAKEYPLLPVPELCAGRSSDQSA